MQYIGIDPGQNGGIAVLDKHGYHCAWPMPVFHKDIRKERGGAIDWASVEYHIKGEHDESYHVILEKVWGMPGQGATSTFNFGGAYHGMLAVIQTLGHDYSLVVPRTWKKAVLADTYSHDKAGAAAFCDYTYPLVGLVAPRCRTIHDGMADALCLAHYGAQEQPQSVR